jgi:hypothetical protein
MAELVDASDSKSGVRKDVQVRFLFWALVLKRAILFRVAFFIFSKLLTKQAGRITKLITLSAMKKKISQHEESDLFLIQGRF